MNLYCTGWYSFHIAGFVFQGKLWRKQVFFVWHMPVKNTLLHLHLQPFCNLGSKCMKSMFIYTGLSLMYGVNVYLEVKVYEWGTCLWKGIRFTYGVNVYINLELVCTDIYVHSQ